MSVTLYLGPNISEEHLYKIAEIVYREIRYNTDFKGTTLKIETCEYTWVEEKDENRTGKAKFLFDLIEEVLYG